MECVYVCVHTCIHVFLPTFAVKAYTVFSLLRTHMIEEIPQKLFSKLHPSTTAYKTLCHMHTLRQKETHAFSQKCKISKKKRKTNLFSL